MIVDKHPILLILVNSRVEPFTFCTYKLDSLLHFFPYNAESLSSNVLFSFQYIFMFLLNISFLKLIVHEVPISKSFLNFPSNRPFHRGSFFAFGSLVAPTYSKTYPTVAYIVLFSSVIFRISVFLSTQLALLTARFTFAFGIPRNDFNCSLSFLYTNIMSCSNILFLSPYKTVPCFSASLVATSHSLLSMCRS